MLHELVITPDLLYKTRRDFHLPEDSVVYLCCQTLYKHLPDHDAVYPQIARCVPNARFVFFVTNDFVRKDFERRLDRAFAAAGLRAADHCVYNPWLPHLDYCNLSLHADVFLDTIGWSGCISTFEAIACGVPVVTLPGKFMRGRQSYAILTQLGVTETIAGDEAEYVDIAVRLGRDRQWRQSVIDQMVASYRRLYSDTRSALALEDFYREATGWR